MSSKKYGARAALCRYIQTASSRRPTQLMYQTISMIIAQPRVG